MSETTEKVGKRELPKKSSEAKVEGYETIIDGFNVINKHEPEPVASEKISISGKKTWNDIYDADGLRPDQITVHLYQNGVKIGTKRVGAADNWSWTFDNQEKYDENGNEIRYTVDEESVPGYEKKVSGFNITNTHIPEQTVEKKITITGSATWDDVDDADGIRPERITIHLYQDGVEIGTRYVGEADGWSWMFDDLGEFGEGGAKITYTIKQNAVAGYETTVDGYNVTNKHVPEEPIVIEKITVAGDKIWIDKNDADEIRPEQITVHLYANGKRKATKTVGAADGWSWMFTDLEKTDGSGKEIEYTLKEAFVEGYETTYDGYDIINTRQEGVIPASRVHIHGSVEWTEDDDNENGTRPQEITVNLFADGVLKKTATVKENEDGEWLFDFGLPLKEDEDGKAIKYTVTEDVVEGYSTTITDTEEKDAERTYGYDYKVVNKLEPLVYYNVTLKTEGKGTAVGGGSKLKDSKVTVTAVPTIAYGTRNAFVGWYKSGKLVSDKKEYTFHVTGDVTLTAKFEPRHLYVDVQDPEVFYYEHVYWCDDNGIVKGWEQDNTFRPMNDSTRAAVITFLWRMMGRPEPVTMAKFKDMPDNVDFAKAISWGVENGICTGYSDNTFRPHQPCNRAAIVTFIWRTTGKPEPNTPAPFKDMTGNTEFDKAISWAAENNITTGWSDATFRPYENCKRLAIVSFLSRFEALRTE